MNESKMENTLWRTKHKEKKNEEREEKKATFKMENQSIFQCIALNICWIFSISLYILIEFKNNNFQREHLHLFYPMVNGMAYK